MKIRPTLITLLCVVASLTLNATINQAPTVTYLILDPYFNEPMEKSPWGFLQGQPLEHHQVIEGGVYKCWIKNREQAYGWASAVQGQKPFGWGGEDNPNLPANVYGKRVFLEVSPKWFDAVSYGIPKHEYNLFVDMWYQFVGYPSENSPPREVIGIHIGFRRWIRYEIGGTDEAELGQCLYQYMDTFYNSIHMGGTMYCRDVFRQYHLELTPIIEKTLYHYGLIDWYPYLTLLSVEAMTEVRSMSVWSEWDYLQVYLVS